MYRPDIDGLRAVAVVSVVLCHAGLGPPGGFVGVDVFFVISGYLITGLILKDLKAGKFSFAEFWTRRVRRIVPALGVVVIVCLIVGWIGLLPEAYASLGTSVVALTLLVANVHFWLDTWYFATAAEEKPLLHTWSLAVEEQFYIVLPVALFALVRIGRVKWTPALLAGVCIASFGLSVYGTHYHPSATFYLLPARAWELLGGGLLACRPARQRFNLPMVGDILSSIGIVLILGPCLLYDRTTPFPGIAAGLPVLGAMLVIYSGGEGGRNSIVGRLLARPEPVFVGLFSYSLYLWHWPVLAFARALSVYPLSILDRGLLLAFSVVLGVLSWRFVELPFRRHRVPVPKGRVVGATVGLGVALLIAGVLIRFDQGIPERLPPETRGILATCTWNSKSYHHEMDVEDIPTRLLPLGLEGGHVEVLVWGDSHAMAVLPAVDAVCREHRVAGRAATRSMTAPVVKYVIRTQFGLNERSVPFGDAVQEYVRTHSVRRVLLVADWRQYTADPDFGIAMATTVEQLRLAGAAVYIMLEVPKFPYHVPKMLAISSLLGNDRSRLAMPFTDHLRDTQPFVSCLALHVPNSVTVLDPSPLLLSPGSSDFLPVDSDGSLFRDDHHLSNHGAMKIAPVFEALFCPQ